MAKLSRTGIIQGAEGRRQYYEALGRFVNAFAKAEAFTHTSFHAFAKLGAKLGMALKGSARLCDLMPIIRRVMEINGFSTEDRDRVDVLFKQLNEISLFRDKLLHRGADMLDDGTFESSNFATMKALENLEIVKFTLADIRNATNDLNRLALRLVMITHPEPADMDEDFLKYLHGPWRYKPVKLETPHQPRRAKPPAQ